MYLAALNFEMQSLLGLSTLFLLVLWSDVVTGTHKTPLCQNEAKVFVRWNKPISGWYVWNDGGQLWTRTPPSAKYKGSTIVLYLFQYIQAMRRWELIFYQKGWDPETILSIDNQTENILEVDFSKITEENSRYKREITLDADSFNETPKKQPVTSLNRPERRIKILCPDPCRCHTVRLHNIGEQLRPEIQTSPVTFYRYIFSSPAFSACRRQFENRNISSLDDAISATGYSERNDIWTPILYMSDECYLLYYHKIFDTWVAVLDSLSLPYGKMYSMDSGECIESLPPPRYQRWEGHTLQDKKATLRSYQTIHVECITCHCKQAQIRTPFYRKSLIMNHVTLESSSKCNLNKSIEHEDQNGGMSAWLHEDFFVTETCDMLFYNHYRRKWTLVLSIGENSKFWYVERQDRCLENFRSMQLWVDSNNEKTPFQITARCVLNL